MNWVVEPSSVDSPRPESCFKAIGDACAENGQFRLIDNLANDRPNDDRYYVTEHETTERLANAGVMVVRYASMEASLREAMQEHYSGRALPDFEAFGRDRMEDLPIGQRCDFGTWERSANTRGWLSQNMRKSGWEKYETHGDQEPEGCVFTA